jgi:hypothetical protein
VVGFNEVEGVGGCGVDDGVHGCCFSFGCCVDVGEKR